MSSRTRTMGAGLAGSTSRMVNINQVQFGNKLQGLAPSATQFFIQSGRGGGNNYQRRADGDKRNFVFCMNQLGGVGRAKSQFKIDGVNQPDGARRCLPYEYFNPSIEHPLSYYIQLLQQYFRYTHPHYDLILSGDSESLQQDLAQCCTGTTIGDDHYINISATKHMVKFPLNIQHAIEMVNAVSKNPNLSFNRKNNGCGTWLGLHTLSLLTNQGTVASDLQACYFGNTIWNTLRVYDKDVSPDLDMLYKEWKSVFHVVDWAGTNFTKTFIASCSSLGPFPAMPDDGSVYAGKSKLSVLMGCSSTVAPCPSPPVSYIGGFLQPPATEAADGDSWKAFNPHVLFTGSPFSFIFSLDAAHYDKGVTIWPTDAATDARVFQYCADHPTQDDAEADCIIPAGSSYVNPTTCCPSVDVHSYTPDSVKIQYPEALSSVEKYLEQYGVGDHPGSCGQPTGYPPTPNWDDCWPQSSYCIGVPLTGNSDIDDPSLDMIHEVTMTLFQGEVEGGYDLYNVQPILTLGNRGSAFWNEIITDITPLDPPDTAAQPLPGTVSAVSLWTNVPDGTDSNFPYDLTASADDNPQSTGYPALESEGGYITDSDIEAFMVQTFDDAGYARPPIVLVDVMRLYTNTPDNTEDIFSLYNPPGFR